MMWSLSALVPTLRSMTAILAAASAAVGLAACGSDATRSIDSASVIIQATQCGPTADFVPVNAYDGPMDWVSDRENAVAFINGACTGTYFGGAGSAEHLILTAGHCVGLGDEALVDFNFEDDPDGSEYVGTGTVVERADEPDYALIELFEDPVVRPAPLSVRSTEELAVIQYARGGPKVIATGVLAAESATEVRYADLDTLVGSSGAGVFNAGGRVIGVHSDGDCDEVGGSNVGQSIAASADVSPLLSLFDFYDDD